MLGKVASLDELWPAIDVFIVRGFFVGSRPWDEKIRSDSLHADITFSLAHM